MLVLLAITTLMYCSSDRRKASKYDAEIVFYHLNYHDRYSEKINVDKIEENDKTTFVYKYDKFRGNVDSLVIYQDSVLFNGDKLTYIRKVLLKNKNEPVEVRKYLDKGLDHAIHIYIERDRGLILFRDLMKHGIIEYHLPELSEDIHAQIMKNKTFFYLNYQNLAQ